MTTSIKVTAHCNPDTTHVLVKRTNIFLYPVEESILENGESKEFTVYDDFYVTVKEVSKPTNTTK